MKGSQQYLLVSADALPEVYEKVLEVKRVLSKGLCKNSTEACKLIGISRSAFYKYRDAVLPYDHEQTQNPVTLYLRLSDIPGVLSSVLQSLYLYRANVLTLNQNIPLDGVADVSLTIRLTENIVDLSMLIKDIKAIDGVVSLKKI